MPDARTTPVRTLFPATLAMALVATLLLQAACSPMTPVRRSLYAPQPTLPARSGAPLDTGEVRMFGQFSTTTVYDEATHSLETMVASAGDPGVYTPKSQLAAGAYFGLNDRLEIGGQIHHSRLSWATANTVGVLPFPDESERSLTMAGLGARFNAHTSVPWLSFSLLAELNLGRIAQASFECIHTLCADGSRTSFTAEDGTAYYRHVDTVSEAKFFGHLAGQLTLSPAEFIHVYGMFGMQNNVRNTGFEVDPNAISETSFERYYIATAALGLELRYKPVFISGTFFKPFHAQERLPSSATVMLQAGVTF